MTEFVQQHYLPGETIAAIATPPGEGGVAIIRISGDEAFSVAARVFSGPVHKYESHTAHYGHIHDQGQHIDDVLLLVMRGKRSFTGEDTVEVHCHGGSIITRRVLDVVIKAGARAARPGEFTFKAFINGKIDLTQAEAVQELISAKNEYAVDAAEKQLRGSLSEKIRSFQHDLTDTAAILEAWVDFPDEGLEFATIEEICSHLHSVLHRMQKLNETFHDGKIIHGGLSLCLVGCPNVGKSSLMNALLEKERAIVTDIPGTTRDLIEDHLFLSGLNLRLTDTAGIRHTEEIIEKEGIRRSKTALLEADLVLLVLDAHRGLEAEDHELLAAIPPVKTIVVWNKTDLKCHGLTPLNFPHVVEISAKQKLGIDQLKKTINQVIWSQGAPNKEEVIITNRRHQEALQKAIISCQAVISGLQSESSPEFVALDMRECLKNLGSIIGTNVTEDILSAIFSKFCIGK